MNNLQIVKHACIETLKKTKKFFFVLIVLFFIQAAFIFSFSGAVTIYLTNVLEISQEFFQDLESSELSEEAIAAGMITGNKIINDPFKFRQKTDEIIQSTFSLFLFLLLIVFILDGLNWAITDTFFTKKNLKSFFLYLAKFSFYTFVAFIILFISLVLFSSIVFKQIENQMPSTSLVSAFILILFTIVTYLLWLSYSSISNTSIKNILKKLKFLVFNEFFIGIAAFLISLVIIIIPALLLVLTVEANIILLSSAIALFLASFIISRLFLLEIMYHLEKEFTRHLLRR